MGTTDRLLRVYSSALVAAAALVNGCGDGDGTPGVYGENGVGGGAHTAGTGTTRAGTGATNAGTPGANLGGTFGADGGPGVARGEFGAGGGGEATSLTREVPERAVGDWKYYEVEGALCRDGSPAGYFRREGSSPDHNLMVFMNGGGVCFDDFLCAFNPKNVGGVSSRGDQIMRLFYATGLDECAYSSTVAGVSGFFGLPPYPQEDFQAGLKDFITEVAGADRVGSYVLEGDLHMHTFRPRFYEDNGIGVSIADWLRDLLDGKATHVGSLL